VIAVVEIEWEHFQSVHESNARDRDGLNEDVESESSVVYDDGEN